MEKLKSDLVEAKGKILTCMSDNSDDQSVLRIFKWNFWLKEGTKLIWFVKSYIYIHKIIHVPQSVDGMVLQDGTFSHLDLLIQKSMCYKHKKTTSRVLKKVLHHRDYKSRKNQLFYPFQKILKVSGMLFCMKQKIL